MHQYNVSNIPTLLDTLFVWFVPSKFTWLWLVVGNRYLQCDGVWEVGVLNQESGLTAGRWCGGIILNVLKGGGMWKGVEKQIF